MKLIRRSLVSLLAGTYILTMAFTNRAPLSAIALVEGRTYDQAHDRGYIDWSGSAQYVSLTHRDGASLPPEEGGTFCTPSCTEWVTRLGNGGMASGSFDRNVSYFEAMVAFSPNPSVGTMTLRACSAVATSNMYNGASSLPGFVSMILTVPAGCRSWSLSASAGFIDFRSVDVYYIGPPATSTSTPTQTPSMTPSTTPTPTSSPTWTPTSTSTLTYTPTETRTPTFTSTSTQTSTPTETATSTDTATFTASPTFTQTFTSTSTDTPSATPTVTSTGVPTNTSTITPLDQKNTRIPSKTNTFSIPASATPTLTFLPTKTITPMPTRTRPTETSLPPPSPTPIATSPVASPQWPLWQMFGLIGLFLIIATTSVVDPRPRALDQLSESLDHIAHNTSRDE